MIDPDVMGQDPLPLAGIVNSHFPYPIFEYGWEDKFQLLKSPTKESPSAPGAHSRQLIELSGWTMIP